jgi:hypothetical protein
MNTPYALFDPNSAYNILRANLATHEKIRGYFYWRQTRRARGEEHPGPSPDRPPLVFRGGSPPVPLQADVTIPKTEPLPGRYAIEVTLREQGDPLPVGAACRAFLVEQDVLERLRARATPAIVCREGESLTLRDLVTGQVRASIRLGRGILSAAVLDEQRVAVRLSSAVRLWDTVSGTLNTVAEPLAEKTSWELPASAAAIQDRCGAHLGQGDNEPLAVGSLRPALGRKDDVALAQLLDHRLLSEDFAVQQPIAALPELEGRLAGNRIVLEANIPPGSPNISDRARVVVVMDAPGE